ncbi:MAG: hypothetical protein UR80_C0010G0003 [Parcubacteria group bacterium GW2011_GWB1_35_5]|nr:MAG: hypothetical protein UR50_C0005G0034 [Parcubacteria group bacterium GW2011_GWC1_34_10]KKP81054.1 MAG: hypothetical protein UR80_C0010G0003 [Parcubacteria group bacterium GW2011_GWB1_35_5]OHA86639.1 MAG: hypothetical protein A2726_02160 [Candidatus Zambryskibacteria bacterium RIFCSPHIGHO2_01_FULL_35_32]
MRFQIPQFIDVEDKIFGPFTLKQFIYLAGGASITMASITLFDLFWGLLLASPIIILSLALAFYKVNNRSFIYIMESAFKYITKDKLYIWKKNEEEKQENNVEKKYSSLVVPNLSESKLKDMNWELDVKKKEDEKISNSS